MDKSNSCTSQDTKAESSRGSCRKEKPNSFFGSFVCDHLAKHSDGRHLVELTENPSVLKFNDIGTISAIYTAYKDPSGKHLNTKPNHMKDNFKNILRQFEKQNKTLEKIGSGNVRNKEFLMYEVNDSALWNLLKSNYSSQRNPHTKHENFRCDGPSSDTSGLGQVTSNTSNTSKSSSLDVLFDGPSLDETMLPDGFTEIDVREADQYLSSMSQSDDQSQRDENFRESRVLTSGPSSDTGDVSSQDAELIDEFISDDADGMALQRLFDDGFDESFNFGQLDLITSENETSQRPPPLSTAVDEKIPESEFTITPNFCTIEGGVEFVVRANQNLREGRYKFQFGDYGTCKALGDGSRLLIGCELIPAARRRGTQTITVHVFDENGTSIGDIPFEYRDGKANRRMTGMGKNSSQGGSNLDNKPHQRKTKSSSNSMENRKLKKKKFGNGAVDTPMLMYLCDEMAKRGDEHFFSALIKLGILADVLAYRSEYYKDVAVTAREHGHNDLAEMIAMRSSELPCVRDMETLTIGKLIDAVQQERSLANYDPIYSSHSDDDSNSSPSGYNGDCDSEDSTDAIFGGCESQNNSDLNDEKKSLDDVIIQKPELPSEGQCCTNGSLKENEEKTDAVLGSCNSHCDGVDVEEKERIFDDEYNGEKTFLVERSLNPKQEETVAGVDNKTTDPGLTKLGRNPINTVQEFSSDYIEDVADCKKTNAPICGEYDIERTLHLLHGGRHYLQGSHQDFIDSFLHEDYKDVNTVKVIKSGP